MTYGSEDRGWRQHFRWILAGHTALGKDPRIIIHLPSVSFQVVVCPHDTASSLYAGNVRRFCQGIASVEVLLDEVDIDRPATEPASGARSPLGVGPIKLKTKLGEGTFGVVWHVWDVSTGEEHALKEPSEKAIIGGRVNVNKWREEARILGRMQHVE